MLQQFNHKIKLYTLLSVVFLITSIQFYNHDSIIHSISTFISFISFFFAIINFIYTKRVINVKRKYINKIEKETKNLNEYEFKEYIETKNDIEIYNKKLKNLILIDQIIYKGKFNEKTLANIIYKKKYGINYN